MHAKHAEATSQDHILNLDLTRIVAYVGFLSSTTTQAHQPLKREG
jgi:hypothetical protein